MNIKIDEKVLLTRYERYIENNSSSYYDKNIEDNEIINNIYKHINKDNINSILLRGSRATLRNNPYSDVDVVVLIKDGGFNVITFKDENGVRYNIRIQNYSLLNIDFKYDDYRFYYGMRTLYDPSGIGNKLINKVNEYEEYACKQISKQNPELKKYLYQVLEFVDGEDELLSKFAKAKILYESPAYLANYNGYNLIGFKNIIDCLIRDNIDLANVYLKALSKNSTKQDIKEWIDKAFNGLCGLNALNTDFKLSKKSFELFVGGKSMYGLYNDYYTFFKTITYLNIYGIEKVDFLEEIKEKAPKLFEKLWSLIN